MKESRRRRGRGRDKMFIELGRLGRKEMIITMGWRVVNRIMGKLVVRILGWRRPKELRRRLKIIGLSIGKNQSITMLLVYGHLDLTQQRPASLEL